MYGFGQSKSTKYTFDKNLVPKGDFDRAKEHFKQDRFTAEQLKDLLGLERHASRRRIVEWLKPENNTGLYHVPGTIGTVAFDPNLAPSKTQQPGRHQSIYVDPDTWEILPKHRQDIRGVFYKNYFRQKRLDVVLNKAKTKEKDANGKPLYECSYANSQQELQGPQHQDKVPYRGDNTGNIDHIIDVAEHWESEGRNMTHAQRNDWYDDPDNLRFLCSSCNKAKKGKPVRTYTFKVGPDFREPNDK